MENEEFQLNSVSATEGGAVSPDGGGPQPKAGFRLDTIFLGPNGLRAGWRLLLYLAVFVALSVVLSALARFVTGHVVGPAKGFTPGVFITGEGLAFLAALGAAAVMGRFEKRTLADYLLPGRAAFGARFWEGALWGFLALTVLLVAMHLAHGFEFGRLALGGRELVSYAASWLAAFILVGFFEEFFVRGYALATLTTGMGFWPSAILLSAVFGAGHLRNPGEDWRGGLAAGLIGIFFCFTVRRTGSLWFAVGFHAAWDYAESFIYSVPDSGAMVTGHLMNSSFSGPAWLTGGRVGPEGSALVFVLIALLAVLFGTTHRAVRFPDPGAAAGTCATAQKGPSPDPAG